jgi:hypothetical protein
VVFLLRQVLSNHLDQPLTLYVLRMAAAGKIAGIQIGLATISVASASFRRFS